MTQINPRTFADAIQLADNVYELILTNWGNRGLMQDQFNGSISYPPVKTLPGGGVPILGDFTLPPIPSLAAIAISPRSLVDRCIVNFASLPQAPESLTPGGNSIDRGFVQQGGILETEQILSIHAPLIGQQPGPIVIRAHADSYFSDTYIPIANNLTPVMPFGTALPTNVGGGLIWLNPELRLLLYMNGRGALPPTYRAPLLFRVSNYTFTSNNEELIAVVPVAGRRYVRVQYKTGGIDVTLNITGVQWNGQPSGGTGLVTNRNFEFPLAGPIAIAGTGSVSVEIDNPGVTFLLVKAKAFVLDTARVIINAYD